jgi:hypothetical protein
MLKIGDASALPALDHAVWHDTGVDYEGRTVAGVAWKAAQRIRTADPFRNEPGTRRLIEEWIAEQQPLPLREIVTNLDRLANHLDIHGRRHEAWSADSVMFLVPPTEYGSELYDGYQLRRLQSVTYINSSFR